jgi:Fur family ferric uptake transcriptional regulator
MELPKQNHNKSKVIHREVMDESAFKQIIRRMNLKVTNQRIAILQSLHAGRAHVSAQEVFENVHREFPEIGFATVYRFLRDLTDLGVVTEVRMGGMPARYEITPQRHHDHLTCTRCGVICEFENSAIEQLQEKVAKDFGFKLTNHVLELYGICPQCMSNSEDGKELKSRLL